MDEGHQEILEAVVRCLRGSSSILFVTGAGISADSGLPTYRGSGGLYDIEKTEEGLPIEEILSERMFCSNPELTWKYLAHIAKAARGATYNRAHQVIAEIEKRFPRVWTLTQNVDGFHRQAGSQNVIEIHGNMRSLSCVKCPYRLHVANEAELTFPPRCPDCATILRPNVVLFGAYLPEEAVSLLQRELEVGFGAVVGIGTSGLFPYIQEPFLAARRRGVPTIEINPNESELSDLVDYRLPLSAARAMDEIWRRLVDHS
jgi:NAD-dependent deacetylase